MELKKEDRKESETWEEINKGKTENSQEKVNNCPCFKYVNVPNKEDVWQGHVCCTNPDRLKDPLTRSLFHKGHTFNLPKNEDSLLQEVNEGLNGYIQWWINKSEGEVNEETFQDWKVATIGRIWTELATSPQELTPQGGYNS